MPNTEPLCTILQPSYSIKLPLKIKNLNYDIEEFLRHRFRSAYYTQCYPVQEPTFIKNPKEPCMLNIE